MSRLLKRSGAPITPGPLLRSAISRPAAGGRLDDEQAMTLTAVYACVKLVAGQVAGMPVSVRRPKLVDDRKTREKLPTPTVLARPLRSMTRFEWIVQVMTSLLLRGNAFLLVVDRDTFGRPLQLEPIHPDRVSIQLPSRQFPEVRYRIDGNRVPSVDLLHLRGVVGPGAVVGLSPISLHARTLNQAINAERFGAEYLADVAAPSSVLTVPGDLDDDEADRLLARWEIQRRGNRRPAVLAGGIQWQSTSISPEESQFLATQEVSWTQACMIFGVPPHRIGHVEKTTSFGSGVEQQNLMFYNDTLRYWVETLESFYEAFLLPHGQEARHNLDALLRGDTQARYGAHLMARQGGWRSVNEIRAIEDEDLIEDPAADDYQQPLNWGPLGFEPGGQQTPPEEV